VSEAAPQRYALLIGATTFLDPQLAALPSAAADVERLATVLGDPELGGFSVDVLLDATCRSMQVSIARICHRAKRRDVVLVYYSGHGLLGPTREFWLAAQDTEMDVLRATALSSGFVLASLRDSRSQAKVLILDTSHSGAALRDVPVPDHLIVVTSSDALEYAFEPASEDDAQSGFTQQLVDGLSTGDADLDGDGTVTFEELFTFARTRMHSVSEHQRPRIFNTDGRADRGRKVAETRLHQLQPRRRRLRRLAR
jgi:chaperonin GroEL